MTKISGNDLGITDMDKWCYVLTYSFPCQALSVAGRMAGMDEGSGTSSSLLWEVKRILGELNELGTLPHVLLMENVTQVHSKRNIENFNRWISFLESIGYRNTWFDMNSKDYGVAQSRNRCFMVSRLGNSEYAQPKKITPVHVMLDYLDDEVPEKYYYHSEKGDELLRRLEGR